MVCPDLIRHALRAGRAAQNKKAGLKVALNPAFLFLQACLFSCGSHDLLKLRLSFGFAWGVPNLHKLRSRLFED